MVQDVLSIGDLAISTSRSIIRNPVMIIYLLQVIYRKTRSELVNSRTDDPFQIFKTFEIINSWMKFLKHNRMVLPPTFEYNFLLEGIYICLNSEQAIIVQIALSFLTVNFSFMPCRLLMNQDRIRLELWNYLKQPEQFMGLFMHWSSYVRISFYRFLYYSIGYLHSKKPSSELRVDGGALDQAYSSISKIAQYQIDDKELVVVSPDSVDRADQRTGATAQPSRRKAVRHRGESVRGTGLRPLSQTENSRQEEGHGITAAYNKRRVYQGDRNRAKDGQKLRHENERWT